MGQICPAMKEAESCIQSAVNKTANVTSSVRERLELYAELVCSCQTGYDALLEENTNCTPSVYINATTTPNAVMVGEVLEKGCELAKFVAKSSGSSSDNLPLIGGLIGGGVCLYFVCVIGIIAACCGACKKGKKRDFDGDDEDYEE